MERSIFQSFDEYAAAVQHADIRVTLARRQESHWALEYLPLDEVSVHWGRDAGPNVVEGSSTAGGLSLFIPRHNAAAIAGNGVRMADGAVMVLEPGAEFCMTSSAINSWSSIFVPYDQLAMTDEAVDACKGTGYVLPSSESGKRLRMEIESLGRMARMMPDGSWTAAHVAIARQRIAESVGRVLGLRRDDAVPAGRRSLSRMEITRAALQILEDRAGASLSVLGLANRIGISERTLRTAFEEYFGVGPARYLKLRTLHRARTMLKLSDPEAVSVTEVAAGLGVWEFGRFSRDYKMLFSEMPSETLRRRADA